MFVPDNNLICVFDQQNRALEAVTLRYFTALCLPMEKTREIFDLHFLAKPGFFQANYCGVTKVEVPNCVLTCNMRNEFVAIRVYQAVKKIQRLCFAFRLCFVFVVCRCFIWRTKAELRARVGRPQTSSSPPVTLLLAVPRRLFCFGSLVVLDVVFRYLSLC